jgi:hypothetical protein
MTSPPVVRALLIGADGTELACQFNPETVERSKSASWRQQHTRGAPKQPRPQFVGTGSEQLKVRLLFDSFDSLGALGMAADVAIEILLSWLTVPPSAQSQATPQPPTVTFLWGSAIHFEGTLRQVSVQYIMFDPEGIPLRAYVTISLVAIPDDPLGTNPTSAGIPGRTSAQLREGDTLASIAYAQYGDPNLWRAIAIANDIDDPARVAIGTRLLVPPRTAAIALSAPSYDAQAGHG